jgi:hypothetical protein
MIDIKIEPQNGQWDLERANVYFLQQIAKSLDSIVRQNIKDKETYDLLEKERSERENIEASLFLMIYKNEIVSMFEGKNSMPISDFYRQLTHFRMKILNYLSRDSFMEAICKTDYLQVEKVGSGFKVVLVG